MCRRHSAIKANAAWYLIWNPRAVLADQELLTCLTRYWGLTNARVTTHDGGMGSRTWFVDLEGHRWVAKAVASADGGQFTAGLGIATRLEQAGIPAGAPVPAADGRLAVDTGSGRLALLTWVPGQPLAGQTTAEQEVIGRTLAAVHEALAGVRVAEAGRFHWVDVEAGHLEIRSWLRPAVKSALEELAAVVPDEMTWGLLHADPAPEAFRLDPSTGRCGVIDWSYAIEGPLLYDLASAVMYVGGTDHAEALVSAYLDTGVIGADEAARGLAPMLTFRWAVQADYFAWRIAHTILTGISGPHENEKGLEDARRALLSRG
jgi:Ser/Thr protein kinase RdoA (MazF antagonist)